MKRLAALLAPVFVLSFASAAYAAGVTYDDVARIGKPASLSVTTHKPAAFRVLLRVQTIGRTQLFLTGKTAPKGGPLLDTKTMHCDGAAGSYYCKGSYEALPAGKYTWTIKRVAGPQENVTLTLHW
jgi:hypothetical protein